VCIYAATQKGHASYVMGSLLVRSKVGLLSRLQRCQGLSHRKSVFLVNCARGIGNRLRYS
jgi:hypothetical protein